ncbi:MAG TPA: hypothetical protein VHB20_14650 [Verrucomicrobiae bacterium]|jgi:hypothetical protein|nr:hypothetical protein [Verrucomicrobiae bacterium]
MIALKTLASFVDLAAQLLMTAFLLALLCRKKRILRRPLGLGVAALLLVSLLLQPCAQAGTATVTLPTAGSNTWQMQTNLPITVSGVNGSSNILTQPQYVQRGRGQGFMAGITVTNAMTNATVTINYAVSIDGLTNSQGTATWPLSQTTTITTQAGATLIVFPTNFPPALVDNYTSITPTNITLANWTNNPGSVTLNWLEASP